MLPPNGLVAAGDVDATVSFEAANDSPPAGAGSGGSVDFDDGLRVGIVPINSATKPLNVGLEMFSIARKGPADGGLEGNDGSQRPKVLPSP
jgi:hypothetical protein